MVRPGPKPLDLIALGGVSAALLALEVLLLRLFEFSHWYHFAGLAVSLAVLGLGAAGTTLALAGRYRITRGDAWFTTGLLITAAGFLLLLLLQSRVALRPLFAGWDAGELGKLLLVDFLAFLPFYGAGLAIGQVFLRWPDHPRALYTANLLGSGAGSLGAAGLLIMTTVETALATVACLLLVLTGVLTLARRRYGFSTVAGLGLILALAAVIHPPAPAVSDFKALSRIQDLPNVETLDHRPGLAGQLTLFRSDSLRMAPGLSLQWREPVPAVDAAVIGSDRTVALPRRWPTVADHARASLGGLPLRLRPEGPVLVLGSGAWQTPLLAGERPVTWVEADGRIPAIARQRGARDAGIQPVEDGAWRYLATAREPFTVIALDRAWEGGDAATEDYVLTDRGLRLALEQLTDNGLLAIPLAVNNPPRHFTRVMTTLKMALDRIGAETPARHVAVLRGMQALIVLASPRPLKENDLQGLERFAEEWRFDTAWRPGLQRQQANRIHRLDKPLFFDISRAVLAGEPLPTEATRFHTRPATLDRPYPWRSLEWSRVSGILESQGARGWSYLDWTLILTGVTTLVATLLAFVLILAPLGRLPTIAPPFTRLSVAGYFTALGLGYMLLELALFQRLIIHLGEPVLTAAIVFAVFLIGSGVGSSMTPAAGSRQNLIRVFAAIGIGLLIALIPFLAVERLSTPPFLARATLLAGLLFPLAWAMGRPFPWALARLARQDRWIPWAWGINGFASVVGASMAPLVSIHLGQSHTLLAGMLCYIAAFLIAARRLRTE